MEFTVSFLGRDKTFDVRDLHTVKVHVIRALYEERLIANAGRVRQSIRETAEILGMGYSTVRDLVRQPVTTRTS